MSRVVTPCIEADDLREEEEEHKKEEEEGKGE